MSCNSSAIGSTGLAGTDYHSGPPEFTQVVCGVYVAQSIVFCVVFVYIIVCVVLFLLAIVMPVLLLMALRKV